LKSGPRITHHLPRQIKVIWAANGVVFKPPPITAMQL